MKGFLRRLRGIIGTGLTWAAGWAGISVVLSLIGGAPLRFLGLVALSGSIQGFIAGGAFAVILSVAERHHTLADLSLRRVALWGGIGGSLLYLLLLPVLLSSGIPLLGGMLVPLVTNALVGAGFASGSVAVARWGDERLIEGHDEQLLEPGSHDPTRLR